MYVCVCLCVCKSVAWYLPFHSVFVCGKEPFSQGSFENALRTDRYGWMDRKSDEGTNRWTDGQMDPLIEMRGCI